MTTTTPATHIAPDFAPVHPGEILAAEFLEPLGISQYRIAKAINVPARRINEIVHGKRGITADTGLRLSRALGLSDMFWVNMQAHYDAEIARDHLAAVLGTIEKLAGDTPSEIHSIDLAARDYERLDTPALNSNRTHTMTQKPNTRHVVPNSGGGWDVKKPGAERASGHFETQADAINRGREILHNGGGGELTIHNKQGEIRAKDTIAPGNDPRSSRG